MDRGLYYFHISHTYSVPSQATYIHSRVCDRGYCRFCYSSKFCYKSMGKVYLCPWITHDAKVLNFGRHNREQTVDISIESKIPLKIWKVPTVPKRTFLSIPAQCSWAHALPFEGFVSHDQYLWTIAKLVPANNILDNTINIIGWPQLCR